jgi:hypothetical protein
MLKDDEESAYVDPSHADKWLFQCSILSVELSDWPRCLRGDTRHIPFVYVENLQESSGSTDRGGGFQVPCPAGSPFHSVARLAPH